MFLRNYDNYWTAVNSQTALSSRGTATSNSTAQYGDGYYNLKAPNGSIYGIYNSYGYDGYSNSLNVAYAPISLSTGCICLGTGSTPVQYDDYKLSGDLVALTLVKQSTSVQFIAETQKWRRILICTCSNLTDADVSIHEWGLYRCNTSNSTVPAYSNSGSNIALMFREVLAEPITIKAGTTSTITFTIEVPMPNHP